MQTKTNSGAGMGKSRGSAQGHGLGLQAFPLPARGCPPPPGSGHVHVIVGGFHGLGGVAHVLEHLRIGVGVLQGLSLELNGRQRAVDLRQLLLIPLLALQGLEGRCMGRTQGFREARHSNVLEVTCVFSLLVMDAPQLLPL